LEFAPRYILLYFMPVLRFPGTQTWQREVGEGDRVLNEELCCFVRMTYDSRSAHSSRQEFTDTGFLTLSPTLYLYFISAVPYVVAGCINRLHGTEFLRNLIVTQLVNKVTACMQLESSLLCSQELVTGS
jgi:hypothetical protein